MVFVKSSVYIEKSTPDERKNLPSENWKVFGYLASLSAARSKKFFKANRIWDDLMFDSNKKEKDIEKSSNKIIRSLKSMEVTWTKQQEAAFKKCIKEIWKRKNALIDMEMSIEKVQAAHWSHCHLKGITQICEENTQGRS